MRATIVSALMGSPLRVVGAAGFEPATWSTQNSRATRLRYAPPGVREYAPVRYTVRSGPARRTADAAQPAGGLTGTMGGRRDRRLRSRISSRFHRSLPAPREPTRRKG